MSEEPQPPKYPNQTQSPYSNYGYPPDAQQQVNPQLRYSVPIATDTTINAPNRWRRWVGYNALAFGLSCVIMLLGTVAMALISDTLRNGLQQFVEKLSFNLATIQTIVILLSFPLFLAISLASMIQCTALYQQVPAKSWMMGSAVSGLGGLFLVVAVIIISIVQRATPDPSIHYLGSVFAIFLISSTGISFFQMVATTQHPHPCLALATHRNRNLDWPGNTNRWAWNGHHHQ